MESPTSVLSDLQAGDVLMAVNGTELSSPIRVRQAYLELHARGGDEDEVTYRRGGDTHTITVGGRPSERVDRSEPAAAITRERPSRYLVDRARLAADVSDDEALAEQLPSLAPATVEGVGSGQRVMRLPRRSIFTDLGLRDGDILLRVGDAPFETTSQLLEQLLEADLGEVTVTLMRRGREREITYVISSGSAPTDESQPGPESQPSSDGP
jgi:S1-C subfamily serine protease